MFVCPRPCPSAGPSVRIRSVLVLSSLFPLWLQTTNALPSNPVNPTTTDIAAEHSSHSTSTKPGLPPIVLICVVATCVFLVALGSISLYFHVRRLRERKKRNEHREKAWQFKDMKRDGLRPTLKTEGGLPSPGNAAPIKVSDPVLMTEATSSPRYPTRAFRW